MRQICITVAGVLLVGMLVLGLITRSQRVNSGSISKAVLRAEAAYAAGNLREAQQFADNVLRQEPHHFRARMVAARCLDARDRPQEALQLLTRPTEGESHPLIEAHCLAGDIAFYRLYQPARAAELYRRALRQQPSSIEANDRLAILLGVTGQWWQQIPVRLTTLRRDRFAFMDLLVLALGEKALLNPELAQQMGNVSQDDPLVLLANARLAIEHEQHERAIDLLQRAVAIDWQLMQAHVLLGTEYFHLNDDLRFADWLTSLPPESDQHPGTWILRGKWIQQRGSAQVALRCFCEAVQRDPNHPDGLYQAATILESMGHHRDAIPFFERATQLSNFVNTVKAADSDNALHETVRAAELAEALGNYWEAWAWTSVAIQRKADSKWARQMTSRLKPLLSGLPLQRTHPDRNPASGYDFRQLPSFDSLAFDRPAPQALSPENTARHFAFVDKAVSAGIDFQYFNGSRDVLAGTRHMYEVMGGGVAVLDFDADDLPDLYFSQGCPWQEQGLNEQFADRLFLNSVSGRFTDVTRECGISELSFSQGTAVGDFDSDGFPDIVVANIGQNRLFQNNGDGTFRDVSHQAGIECTDWTTSAAIADVSGDGHPEILFANYLGGDDVFSRTCGPQNDRVCLPQHFPAARNRLYWNQGNQQFRDITQTSGIDVDHGKSLGMVVASFGDSSGLDIFVANDTVSNFYFKNKNSKADQAPVFQEMAMVSGLALNGEGTAQACMGVAAGDADGDGRTDLFVTNFHGESNTLYRQLDGGQFEDASLRLRLRQPGLSKLGFGTQFLDADLDGMPDLIVANGHIDNYSQDGRTEYQMRPQFFANLGPEGFREVGSETLGPYFRNGRLGRSLAKIDWNSDSKEDVVVMHLDAPVALLENHTVESGNSIVLTLRGVTSSRDAIGAIVEIETDHLRLTRQLTAGDGFQASNQRVLTFGLGDDRTVRKLQITWPSGQVDQFVTLPANSRWTAIEGRHELFLSSFQN